MSDIDDDARLLLVAFGLLAADRRSELLKEACVAAIMASAGEEETHRYYRSWGDRPPPVSPTPEMLASDFLARYMPRLPCGYLDDFGFEHAYRDRAGREVEQRGPRFVLCSTSLDEAHADELLCDLWGCASDIGPSFGAPKFDNPHGPEVTGDGFLDTADTLAFIRKWRENLEGALLESASKGGPAQRS